MSQPLCSPAKVASSASCSFLSFIAFMIAQPRPPKMMMRMMNDMMLPVLGQSIAHIVKINYLTTLMVAAVTLTSGLHPVHR